jgi:hypothetical protein
MTPEEWEIQIDADIAARRKQRQQIKAAKAATDSVVVSTNNMQTEQLIAAVDSIVDSNAADYPVIRIPSAVEQLTRKIQPLLSLSENPTKTILVVPKLKPCVLKFSGNSLYAGWRK